MGPSDDTLVYSAPFGTHFNAHSYENAEVNRNVDLQFELASGLNNLRLNNAALSNTFAQYDDSAVGSVSTFGSNSTASHDWNKNTIDNSFYKAIHEQNNDYSFVLFF